MARFCDESGAEVVVGNSNGYWLNEDDFVSTAQLGPRNLGKLGFPRDWPNVYSTSKVLKSLIGKKGSCAGKKVGVVTCPTPDEVAQVKGVALLPLQSFSNAERVEKATGMPIVRGWAVFEHMDQPTSAAFVAERYWWNSLPDGKWVDFNPRPQEWTDLLLAEAALDASKSKAALSASEHEICVLLLSTRFGAIADTSPPATIKEVSVELSDADVPPTIKPIVERVIAGDKAALSELEEKIKGTEKVAIEVAKCGVVVPLLKLLKEDGTRTESLRLLLVITDAGVGQKSTETASSLIAAGIVPHLSKLIASGSPDLQENAAAVIGNLCHESPENQGKVSKSGVIKPLVDLLSADIGPAQEAAYALWNIMVGNDENSGEVVKSGAVPKLAQLLKANSDIAQENAAGALMHISMSAETSKILVQTDAIQRLCELLQPSFEPEVTSQAAGALLNLASDCPENAKLIVKHGALGPLINLVKDGPDLAREYAAGALMNIIREDMDVAAKAAKEGAIPVLAGLLSRSSGHSEALGALANLATDSADRQILIYKAQVTRKSVALLRDKDVDTRRSAAALIMNLAPHPKIKERIVEAGALKPLAASLKDSDTAVRERAAGALANIFNDHSANVHSGFEQAPEMIPMLIDMLQGKGLSDDARRQAAHAVAMLAAEDGPCDAVWSAKPGPPLLALLKDMVAEAALGIMNLCWRWPEVKEQLAKDGAMDYLVKMLTEGDTLTKEYAAGALMNMTAGSADHAERCVSVVKNLVELLKADGVQAPEWGAGALANIMKGRPGAAKEATAYGAAGLLAGRLSKVSNNGKSLVVLALTAIAENQQSDVQKALSGSKEKAKLREFRDSGNGELQEYTNTLAEKAGITL